jgi:hypothetical protein
MVGQDDEANRQARLEAQFNAVLNTHSGQPQVTIQEWALLLRSNADKPMSFEELLPTFYTWFAPGISTDELMNLIYSAKAKGWIVMSDDEDGIKCCWTTPLGREVLAQVERPLMLGGLYKLTGSDLPAFGAGIEDTDISTPPPARPGETINIPRKRGR